MEKGIALLCGTEIPAELIFKPIAQIAGRGGAVFVVDGENSFRSYLIARFAREMSFDPRRALASVHVARAFTCYQLTELVTRLNSRADNTHCTAIVCLGLLGTFYDEDVPLPEARRLLQEVIAPLKLLAERLPVLVTVRPPPPQARNRIGLVRALIQRADAVCALETSEHAGRINSRQQLHQVGLRRLV